MAGTVVIPIDSSAGIRASTSELDLSDSGVFIWSESKDRLTETAIHKGVESKLTEVTLVSASRFGCVYRARYQGKKRDRREPVVLRAFHTPRNRNANDNILLATFLEATRRFPTLFPAFVDRMVVEDNTVIATKFVTGERLDVYLSFDVGVRRFAQSFKQIAAGLAILHKAGFLHLDLKPANILVRAKDNQAVFFDVGAWGKKGHGPAVLVSSWRYVAPEVLLERSLPDPRTDIYALGASLLELLLARQPALDFYETLRNVKWRRRVEADTNDDPATQLFRLAAACTSADPARRPALPSIVRFLNEATLSDMPIHELVGDFVRRHRSVRERFERTTIELGNTLGLFVGVLTMLPERKVPLAAATASVIIAVFGLVADVEGTPLISALFFGCAVLCEVGRGLTAKLLYHKWNASIIGQLRSLGLGKGSKRRVSGSAPT